jgi:outer membrane protein OmpA-like peptidoglycan-associated protein
MSATPVPQVAAAPPVARGAQPTARIGFGGESTEVPDDARTELRGVVEQLKRNGELRLRIEGFAGSDDANRSRRLSLSRALAIRGYLMDPGIASTRMDVFARGAIADGGPVDRVDVTTFRR